MVVINCAKNDFISVIVAVKNEEEYIAKCLDSLIDQSISRDLYQIVVVDGKSDDSTQEIVARYASEYPDLIKLYTNEGHWQSIGRNIAIKNEDGSNLIAYIDGHCKADRNWLKNLYHSLVVQDQDYIAGVGSVHFSPSDESLIGRAIEQVYRSPLGGQGSSFKQDGKNHEVSTVPYVLYKKNILKLVGLYDEDMKVGEDFSLNYKIRHLGYKLLVNPNAIVYYYKRKTYGGFAKQMYNYGFAKAVLLSKYPSSINKFHYAPPIFVILFVVSILGSILSSTLKIFSLIITIFYIFFIIYFSLISSLRTKSVSLLLIMPILFIIQLPSYSFGFFMGIIKRGWSK